MKKSGRFVIKVLITGAFGFVGVNLAAYLADRGYHLIALDVVKKESAAYSEGCTWDHFDQIDWSSVDAVIHLAGKAHDTRTTSDAQSYFDINVGLTRRVFDRFCASNAKRFVFFSSVKAVADYVEGALTEKDVPAPHTPYGQSKREAESYLNLAQMAEGRRVYILRPCMIHGPGNKGNLNLLYKVIRKGIPWPLGAFENRRSFTSIGNVCAVVEGLLSEGVPAGVYQVADDEALATNELIKLIAQVSGRRAWIWNIPVGLMRGVARIGDVLRLPLNSERLKKLTESYVVSNAKIKEALGWKKMPIRAEDGLRKTLAGFSLKT